MEKITKENSLFSAGLILNLISFGLYLLVKNLSRGDFLGYSLICFVIAIIYMIIVLIAFIGRNKGNFFDYRAFVPLLILFSISCFCLNTEIRIFSDLVNWAAILLIVLHLSMVLWLFREKLPAWLNTFIYFILGLGTPILLIYSIILMPVWAIGIIGMILLGITIHVYIPAIIFILIILFFLKTKKKWFETSAYLIGSIIPVMFIVLLVYWQSKVDRIALRNNEKLLTDEKSDLPDWVEVSIKIPYNWFTERVLKTDLMYDPELTNWNRGFGTSFSEQKKCDPIVTMCNLLTKGSPFTEEEKIKVLNTSYDTRHLSRRKLWSGENLYTSEIMTNIRVYPEYRICYTEKFITINNDSKWGFDQEEALYSFKLPKGSTATSLSLWINGKEEKSRLSAKGLADSAYATIVGVETRDPSVLHWQEGDLITVTIFPVTPKSPRMFKVGYTSPMRFEEGNLFYEPEIITGPPYHRSRETSLIRIISDLNIEIEGPTSFKKTSNNEYKQTGKYHGQIAFHFKAPQLSENAFTFDNQSYSIKPIEKKSINFNPKTIYLDLNKNWNKKDYEKVLEIFKGSKIYVAEKDFIKIDDQNEKAIFDRMSNYNFSLFPFHQLSDLPNSLVISKCGDISPNLDELKESVFASKLKEFLSMKNEKILLFNIGKNLTPYLQTLDQFGSFELLTGSLKDLEIIKQQRKTEVISEKENEVNIPLAGMKIVADTLKSTGNAPDHLLRLFAYNKVLNQAGKAYFNNLDSLNADLVAIAEKAFVVTPVSSLVVLESKADYERFGIKENEGSLGNASANSSGAVPEPHEWALIIMALMIVAFISFRKRFSWMFSAR